MRDEGRHARRRGQSMAEFTLVAPLLFLVIFATIDFARLVYAYSAITSASREGARVLSLKNQRTSDCLALKTVEAVAQGFNLGPDPASRVGNSDPNNPSGPYQPTPPQPGQGYIYIYPAVAPQAPQDTYCDSTQARAFPPSQPGQVAVEVQYNWRPMVSFVSSFAPGFTIKTISVVSTEY